MGGSLKVLAGETIVYGVSTMTGRLLNWLLMPFYIRVVLPEEYGVIINFYGVISILLVIFTFGLETGFFRFSRLDNRADVFKTSLVFIGISSLFLILFVLVSNSFISSLFFDDKYNYSIILVGLIVAIDCFIAVPFAKLRLDNQAIKFGVLKLISIFLNIFFNLFFLLLTPYLIEVGIINLYWSQIFFRGNGVFYVLLSNVLSSFIIALFFINDIKKVAGKFSKPLLNSLFMYSWPVLVVGITGMLIQNIDKVLIPLLIKENGFIELAIYGANFKIGVLMSLFTQSFRFAFEPYFFKNQGSGNVSYARIMDYFIFFGVCIFLGVMFFLDIINNLLTTQYLRGNIIIPYVLIGQLFYGIYFNLSLWYKLSDKTIYGAVFGVLGSVITVLLNVILIPVLGIIGGAISMMCGYGLMMVISYFIGQRVYNIPYSLERIGLILFSGSLVYLLGTLVSFQYSMVNFVFKATIFALYVVIFLFIARVIKVNTIFSWLKLK